MTAIFALEPADREATRRTVHPCRRGFTLVEILFSILIIGILLALLIVGLRAATGAGRAAAETQNIQSLKIGVGRFIEDFGFVVPLVRDQHPGRSDRKRVETIGSQTRIAVYRTGNATDLAALKARTIGEGLDHRFSRQSLPYYLSGALSTPLVTGKTVPIDGVPGPGFLKPRADGTFEVPPALLSSAPDASKRSGTKYDPLVSGAKSSLQLYSDAADATIVEFRDRGGRAYRFYRWVRGDASGAINSAADLNIPWIVGDPTVNAEARGARYAIVAAGPDGLFGDEDQLETTDPEYLSSADLRARLGLDSAAPIAQVRARAQRDNVVGVGR